MFFLAAKNNNAEVFELFTTYKETRMIDWNIQNQNHNSITTIIARYGTKIMIDKVMKIDNIDFNLYDENYNTISMIAVLRNIPYLVEKLIKKKMLNGIQRINLEILQQC